MYRWPPITTTNDIRPLLARYVIEWPAVEKSVHYLFTQLSPLIKNKKAHHHHHGHHRRQSQWPQWCTTHRNCWDEHFTAYVSCYDKLLTFLRTKIAATGCDLFWLSKLYTEPAAVSDLKFYNQLIQLLLGAIKLTQEWVDLYDDYQMRGGCGKFVKKEIMASIRSDLNEIEQTHCRGDRGHNDNNNNTDTELLLQPFARVIFMREQLTSLCKSTLSPPQYNDEYKDVVTPIATGYHNDMVLVQFQPAGEYHHVPSTALKIVKSTQTTSYAYRPLAAPAGINSYLYNAGAFDTRILRHPKIVDRERVKIFTKPVCVNDVVVFVHDNVHSFTRVLPHYLVLDIARKKYPVSTQYCGSLTTEYAEYEAHYATIRRLKILPYGVNSDNEVLYTRVERLCVVTAPISTQLKYTITDNNTSIINTKQKKIDDHWYHHTSRKPAIFSLCSREERMTNKVTAQHRWVGNNDEEKVRDFFGWYKTKLCVAATTDVTDKYLSNLMLTNMSKPVGNQCFLEFAKKFNKAIVSHSRSHNNNNSNSSSQHFNAFFGLGGGDGGDDIVAKLETQNCVLQ